MNSFFGDINKKRGWNREDRGKCESSEFFVLNSFFGDTNKKEDGIEKENKTNRNVGLIVMVWIIKCGSTRILDRKRILR